MKVGESVYQDPAAAGDGVGADGTGAGPADSATDGAEGEEAGTVEGEFREV